MKNICMFFVLIVALAAGNVFATTTPESNSGQPEVAAKLSEKVNINTADEAVLVSLPGIGPKTAAAIISFRDQHGKFNSIQELTQVKGIGEKKVKKIEPYLEAM